MFTITSVKKNKNTYDIYINDAFAFEISEEDYIEAGLYEKTELTDAEYRNILDTTVFSKSKRAALNFIAFKMRTVEEVRRKLILEKINPEIVEKTVFYLLSSGYLNDEDYARRYITDRIRLKPRSKMEINHELRNKGVDRSITEKIISELMDDEFEIIKSIFIKKFTGFDLNDAKAIGRIYSYFYNKGFGEEIISKAILYYRNANEV